MAEGSAESTYVVGSENINHERQIELTEEIIRNQFDLIMIVIEERRAVRAVLRVEDNMGKVITNLSLLQRSDLI